MLEKDFQLCTKRRVLAKHRERSLKGRGGMSTSNTRSTFSSESSSSREKAMLLEERNQLPPSGASEIWIRLMKRNDRYSSTNYLEAKLWRSNKCSSKERGPSQ